MSLVSTKTPIFDDIPSIEFFNGRLLSGEDMTTEQAWNAARRKLLGQALGSGVAFGLEVSVSTKTEHAGKPIVTVEPGLALNAEGATLSLTERTDVSLVRIEETETLPTEFTACQPTQYSAYVKSDGVFLLTLCPAQGTQGRAPVSGLANQEARCNRKYRREGVQFRLHQIKLTGAELTDRNKLRNLVAYKCFNPDAWQAFVTDPFGAPKTKPKLLDGLLVPKLEDSEVPLATIFWTTDGGIEYVDLWSVRRHLGSLSGELVLASLIGEAQRILAQAMSLQFREHLVELWVPRTARANVKAADFFQFLPAVGLLPVSTGAGKAGFVPTAFFDQIEICGPFKIDIRRLELLTLSAVPLSPVHVHTTDFLWVYEVQDNSQAHVIDTTVQPYLVFVASNIPYMGDRGPDILRLAPSDRVQAGGSLEIVGTNLPSTPGDRSVDFDGQAVTHYFSMSRTKLVVAVPVGLVGLPKTVTVTVRDGGESDTAAIYVVPERPIPRGRAVVTDITGLLGPIEVGNTYTFRLRLASQTTIPESYRLSSVFIDVVGSTGQQWEENTRIGLPGGQSVPPELRILPSTPAIIHLVVTVPDGAQSVTLALGVEPVTNPQLEVSNTSIPISIGEQPPLNDPRITFTLESLGPFARARLVSLEGMPGYEVAYNQGELITVTASFEVAGNYAYSWELESNPGDVWALTDFSPTSPTGEIAGSRQEISIRLTLNAGAGPGGAHPERSFLRIKSRRTNTDATGSLESWVRFPIQGYTP